MYLVLIRHGESVWNKENRFTGWTDVELSETGIAEAKKAGLLLKEKNMTFDIAYTSVLKRAINTLDYVLENLGASLEVVKDYRLNERHYGALQGLNKDEMRAKYGEEQVHIWRRSYNVRPPKLEETDERYPGNMEEYFHIDKNKLPFTESLEDTFYRVKEIYDGKIKQDLLKGKNVLLVAHGNSLRALIKDLEQISDDEITKLEIPTGVPIIYEFDENLNIISKEWC